MNLPRKALPQQKKYIENINYNIAFSFTRTGETLEGVVEYNVHRYHKEAIKKMTGHFIAILFLFVSSVIASEKQELALAKVTDNVWAIVGPLTNRTIENLGNNATFGFVVTDKGVVLIDSGGSLKGAQEIHRIIKTVTNQSIRYVINTGGQDHRWFGNRCLHHSWLGTAQLDT